MQLSLSTDWTVADNPLDSGGFGKVYEASSATTTSAVAKLVPKLPGAQREMLFVDLKDVRNVVPIIDSGETPTHWVLIMPRAEKSLRKHFEENAGPLPVTEVIGILTDVATTLVDLTGQVVHRDVKPENILFLDGHWCLADFGISRYASASTAPDTQKYSLSPWYAGPERWRNEHAEISTDVYSLGVVAHELLSRSLPFAGPDMGDFRDQHLHVDPPALIGVPAGLAALVQECLYKPAAARPSPSNLLLRLERVTIAPKSGGIAKLEEANQAEAERRGKAERERSQAQTEFERRTELNFVATKSLAGISEALMQTVDEAASTAQVFPDRHGGWEARLNNARFTFGRPQQTDVDKWRDGLHRAIDVIAHAQLGIEVPPDRSGYTGRSHSLWYCDAQEAGRYQWFETAFMFSPLLPKQGNQDPFALDPGRESGQAVGVGMATVQVAWPFTPLSIGQLDEFIGRWTGWFADASLGNLRHPSSMPERSPQGSWRTS